VVAKASALFSKTNERDFESKLKYCIPWSVPNPYMTLPYTRCEVRTNFPYEKSLGPSRLIFLGSHPDSNSLQKNYLLALDKQIFAYTNK
jgi:hypothetical protein